MYALVYFWTGSVSAAFVAGLLFGIHPGRIGDPAHPYVHGNQWTPLALLFAHRLFARRRGGTLPVSRSSWVSRCWRASMRCSGS